MANYLSVDQLSTYLNLSKSTLYKKCSNNSIPYIKTGKKLIFSQEAIDSWLQQHARKTMSDIQENLVGFLKQSRNKD